MAANEVFARLIAEAEQLAGAGAWDEAAARWVTAAGLARDIGADPTAASLYGAAAEAYRRQDRPGDALNALQLSLALADASQVRASLSAVLSSMGRMEGALDAARAAGGELGADAEAGVLLATGARAQLAEVVERMPAGLARRFRHGQWLRMEGRLPEAREHFLALEHDLAEHPAGRGGARIERAEVEALQGEGQASSAVFEEAAADHARAHRTALVWAARSASTRCLLDAGVQVLEGDLPAGLAWARERGLTVLALDLGTCLARIRGDAARLGTLREEAQTLGLIRRAGRAELARVELLSGPAKLLAVQDAVRLLAEDRPLAWRATVAQVEVLHGMAPAAAARLAEQVVTEVERAGMQPERDRLAALEG